MSNENLLYKFLGLTNNTVRVEFLDNQLFRFTQPRLLNDPFEMKPRILMNEYSEDDYKIAREEAHHNGLNNISDDDLRMLFLETIPKGRYDEKRFPTLYPAKIPKLREEPFKTLEEIYQFEADTIYANLMDELHKYGIFSLTENKDSLLMWSHYAEHHKGIVVGFDRDHPFFKNSNNLYKVEYGNTRVSITSNEGIVRIGGMKDIVPLRMLFRKHTDWSYEIEWRMISKLEECDQRNNDVCLFKIPNTAIKSIILGAQLSPCDEENIHSKIIGNQIWSHLMVFKAKLSKYTFGLEFEEVSFHQPQM